MEFLMMDDTKIFFREFVEFVESKFIYISEKEIHSG